MVHPRPLREDGAPIQGDEHILRRFHSKGKDAVIPVAAFKPRPPERLLMRVESNN